MFAPDALELQIRSREGGRRPCLGIFRALPGLGDFLCVVPALRALRGAFPDAEIVFIGVPGAKEFVSRFGRYVDRFLEFPGWPGLPERVPTLEEVDRFLDSARRESFDLVLQMHGSGSITNMVTDLFGARMAAGFYPSEEPCPDPEHFLPWLERESEIRRYLRLLEHLGIPAQGEELEFLPLETDLWDYLSLARSIDLPPKNCVCIHPGASTSQKRWPAPCFAAVADSFAQGGATIVLTGTAEEAALTSQVAKSMAKTALDLTGRTSLGTLALLLTHFQLVISNDTGVSHLAAALDVPSVTIFTGSDPDRWAPLNTHRHRVIHQHGTVEPCLGAQSGSGFRCVQEVTPELVAIEARSIAESRALSHG